MLLPAGGRRHGLGTGPNPGGEGRSRIPRPVTSWLSAALTTCRHHRCASASTSFWSTTSRRPSRASAIATPARVFTVDERAYCDEKDTRSAARYAARFAAKEATIKVLRLMPDEAVDLAVDRSSTAARWGMRDRPARCRARARAPRRHRRARSIDESRARLRDGDCRRSRRSATGGRMTSRWNDVHAAPLVGSRHAPTSQDA